MTEHPNTADLRAVLEAYLAQRHALGFQLIEEERHARRFLEWLATTAYTSQTFTAAQATTWAHGDGTR